LRPTLWPRNPRCNAQASRQTPACPLALVPLRPWPIGGRDVLPRAEDRGVGGDPRQRNGARLLPIGPNPATLLYTATTEREGQGVPFVALMASHQCIVDFEPPSAHLLR